MEIYWILVPLLSIVSKGWSIGGFIDPPSGSLIVGSEGDENVTTLDCEIFRSSSLEQQITTLWFIQDFRNTSMLQIISDNDEPFSSLFLITGTERNDIPGLTSFRNNLTILRLNASLDGSTVFCGSGTDEEIGNFSIRIYRKPSLIDNLQVNVVEGTLNAMVDLSESPPAFPFPRTFQWQFNGAVVVSNTTTITLGYPTALFSNVSRTNSGNYSLSAANFRLDDPNTLLGIDSGTFTLNVLYGPDLMLPNTLSFATLEGDNVTLVCGTNLESNPPPSRLVEWRLNRELIDTSSDRYLTNDGPDEVSLTIFGAMQEDTGNWTCRIVVEFMPDASTVIPIREIVRELSLTVVVPPSPPTNLTVDSIGATSVLLSWESPNFTGTPIYSEIEISATPTENLNSFDIPEPVNLTATLGQTPLAANLSGLLPNVEYEFTVRAVSVLDIDGDDIRASSELSEAVMAQTHTTTPAIVCSQAPVSQNGVIEVVWDYDHLGGLNITSVMASYRIEANNEEMLLTLDDVGQDLNDLRSFEIARLTAGLGYVFSVMAANDNGTTVTECPSGEHLIGIPQPPVIVNTASTSSQPLVVSVRTPESGVENPSTISFVIQVTETPSRSTSNFRMTLSNYVDDQVVDIELAEGALVAGLTYEVIVKVENQFGESEYSESVLVTISDEPTSTSSSVGGIVGGIVGGVVVIIIAIIILVVIILLVCKRKYKMDSLPRYSYGSHEMVDNDLYAKSNRPKLEEETKDGQMDPNYETVPHKQSKITLSKDSLYDSLPPAPPQVDNPLYSSTGELRQSRNLESFSGVPQPSQSVGDLTSSQSNEKKTDENLSGSNPDGGKGEQGDGAWYATVPTPISVASRSTHTSAASLGMADSDILPPPPPMVHPEEHVYTEL